MSVAEYTVPPICCSHVCPRLLSLLSENLAENDRTASALHAKCLVCDKPVNTLNSQIFGPKSPVHSLAEAPMQPIGYDKGREREIQEREAQNSSNRRRRVVGNAMMGSASVTSFSTDVSVVRSSIDLPPLGVICHFLYDPTMFLISIH